MTIKLEKGDVYGFIGPNGAGKTTTMRILATLLNPTWGEATVCGYSIYNGAKEIRRLMGYMPDFFGVYDDMKVIEYLEFFAAAYRIHGPRTPQEGRSGTGPGGPGLQTRCPGHQPVARHDPAAWPGSRPASRAAGAAPGRAGQRPRSTRRIEMRGLLKELRNMGKTILVSSHILPELADICNKIGIIEKGKLLFDGDVASAIRQVQQHTVLTVGVANGLGNMAREHLEGHIDVLRVEMKDDDTMKVTLNDGVHDGSFIADILVKNGFRLKMLKEEEIDLEDVFMGITKGITN